MNTRNVTNTAFVSYPATGVQLPDGRQLTNSYDALYRRTLVHDQTNSVDVAAWQFFGPSRVAEVTLGNGLICTWMNNARTHSAVQPTVANPAWSDQSSDRLGYDGAGRPITKRYLAGGINGSTHAYNNPSALVGFTTEYDLASNKFYERHLHAESRSHLYEPFQNGSPTGGYDSSNRLRQYQRGVLNSTDGFAGNGGGSVATPIALPGTDTQRTYDLDSLGNWRRTVFTPEGGSKETEVRQHNGLNEITRIQNGASQTNPTYDGTPGHSNGNLKNDGTRSYSWDALNRLVQVNRVGDGAVIGQYVYDAMNRRIRKTVSSGGLSGTIPDGTTDCIYSGWRCVEERNPFGGGGSTDTPTAQYIWGIYLDECLQQRLLVALNNFSANSDLYPLQDLLYRTTGLADSSGIVREAYDTDAYGNTLIFRNNGNPPAPIAWSDSDTQVNFPTCPFIFTGQRFDAESDMYYFKCRYFESDWGRFLGKDALLYSNGLNPFAYVSNSPTNAVDPLGRDEVMQRYFLNWVPRNVIAIWPAGSNQLFVHLIGYTNDRCTFSEIPSATYTTGNRWFFSNISASVGPNPYTMKSNKCSCGIECYNYSVTVEWHETSFLNLIPVVGGVFDDVHYLFEIQLDLCADGWGKSVVKRKQANRESDMLPNEWPTRPAPRPVKHVRFCFPSGTPVLCTNGLRPIESLKAGDAVVTYDLVTKALVSTRVTRLLVHNGSEPKRVLRYLVGGNEVLSVTPGHPIFDGEEWVLSEDLAGCHHLMSATGTRINIEPVLVGEQVSVDIVYNVLTESGTFVVGLHGMLVSGAIANDDAVN